MKRVFAIFFILLLLTSNINITLGMHLCGGSLFDSEFMIGHQHMDCGMASMDQLINASPAEEGVYITPAPCCDDQFVSLDTEDDFKQIGAEQLTASTVATAFVMAQLIVLDAPQRVDFQPYIPPAIPKDFQQIHQVFII